MATAYGYTTAKRHNSTLQPTGGTSIDVELKGGCDLNSPLFLLNHSGVPTYSMISFEGRYYFVDSIRSVRNNLWELQCSVDVLATYKSNIQATTAYVLFYNHSNSELCDKRLGVKTTKSFSEDHANFGLLGSGTATNSVVIASIVGESSTGVYAIDQSDAKYLTSDLNTWYNSNNVMGPKPQITDFTSVVEWLGYMCGSIWEAIKQFIGTGHVNDCIKNAFLLPLPYSGVPGTTGYIELGQYTSQRQGKLLNDRIFTDTVTVAIPWQATDWRRNAPYHEIYLYIPYIGLIQISPSDVMGDLSITVKCSLDLMSGDAIFHVYTGSHSIGQYHTNLAGTYAIGSSNVTPVQAFTSIVTSVTGIMGNIVSASQGGAVSGTSNILGLLNAIEGQPSCIGSNCGGAALGIGSTVYCFTIFHDVIQGIHAISGAAGEPFNGAMSLSGVSGYVQTVAASVSGAMTDTEREEVNRLLDGGIYIE